MTKRQTIAVTEVEETGPTGGTRRSHPAFGVMKASRFQGGHMTLYGSPLIHNGGISVSIELSDEQVSFSHSHYWPKHGLENRVIVDLCMSEAQWAAFISTLNVGSGVPVTLQYARTGYVEALPHIEDSSYEQKRSDDIRKAVEEQNAALTAAIKKFDELLKQPSIKKSELASLRSMFMQPVDHAASNMQFRADMLTEHGEKLIESAKAEVSAMVTRMQMQFPQLSDHGIEIKQIENKS